MLSLEELGATGNKGLAGIVGNPVLSQAIAGLATSATAQATLERVMLFDLKDKIIEPFGETAQQVFARISAMRDSLDGPQVQIGCTNAPCCQRRRMQNSPFVCLPEVLCCLELYNAFCSHWVCAPVEDI